MGLKLSHSCLSLPSLGIREMIASLHEGGISSFLSTQLLTLINIGASLSLSTLYHSEVKLSAPGKLLAFSLVKAKLISSNVTSALRILFWVSVTSGRWSECKKLSICKSLSNCS